MKKKAMDGIESFRRSLAGHYEMSPQVRTYIDELTEIHDGAATDKANLMADKRAIARDMNAAIKKIFPNG